jgi:CRAL/TRIO, N-terminal domain
MRYRFRLFQLLSKALVFRGQLSRRYLISVAGVGLFAFAEPPYSMAPLELSGRPDNLTEEQKVKLKEMWTVAFRVFGMPIETSNRGALVSRTNTELSELKDKKTILGSLFRKKKESTLMENDVSRLAIADGEDKYSQTKDFKEALANNTPQEIHDTFWRMVKADHPDALFLRFLRARKWNVEKAIVMLVATLSWRTDKQIDVLSPGSTRLI